MAYGIESMLVELYENLIETWRTCFLFVENSVTEKKENTNYKYRKTNNNLRDAKSMQYLTNSLTLGNM